MKKLFLGMMIFCAPIVHAMNIELDLFGVEQCMFCPAGQCACTLADHFESVPGFSDLFAAELGQVQLTVMPVAVPPVAAIVSAKEDQTVSGHKRRRADDNPVDLPLAKRAKPLSIARILGEKIKPGRFAAIPAPSAPAAVATRSATITPALAAAASAVASLAERPTLTEYGQKAIYWCLCNKPFAEVATPRVVAHQDTCEPWKALEAKRRAAFKALSEGRVVKKKKQTKGTNNSLRNSSEQV